MIDSVMYGERISPCLRHRNGRGFRAQIVAEHAAHPLRPVPLIAEDDAAPPLAARRSDGAPVEDGGHADTLVTVTPAHALDALVKDIARDRRKDESARANAHPVCVLVLNVETREVEVMVIPMCARDCVLVIAHILEHAADAPPFPEMNGRSNAEAARGEVHILLLPHGRQFHVRLAVEPAVVAPEFDARQFFGCRCLSGRGGVCGLFLRGGSLFDGGRRLCRSTGKWCTEQHNGYESIDSSHKNPPIRSTSSQIIHT